MSEFNGKVEKIKEKAAEILNKKSEPQNLEEKIKKNLKVKVVLDEMESIIQDEDLSDEEAFQRLEYVDRELDKIQKT